MSTLRKLSFSSLFKSVFKIKNIPLAAAILFFIVTLRYATLGFIFCLFLTSLFLAAVDCMTDKKNRRFIIGIIVVSILFRLLALILSQYYCFKNGTTDIFGDGSSNLEHGYTLKGYITGESVLQKSVYDDLGQYNVHGKTYFNAIFFAAFGKDILSVKYLNILCFVVLAWMIYDLTSRIYSSFAGKIAMSIILFWPTQLVWSITDLKEGHFFLALTTFLWLLNKLNYAKNHKQRIVILFFLILSAAYASTIRMNLMPLIFTFTLALTAWYNLFSYTGLGKYKIFLRLLLIVFLLGILLFISHDKRSLGLLKTCYDSFTGSHISFLGSGGWNYDVIGDINQNFYTVKFFTKFLSLSVLHFLLEPLPWHIFSVSILLVYPFTLLWYALLFFSVIGIIRLCRAGKAKEVFAIITFVVLYVSIVAMSIANIGTAIRLRDAIMPIVAMFASCGAVTHMEARNKQAFEFFIKCSFV